LGHKDSDGPAELGPEQTEGRDQKALTKIGGGKLKGRGGGKNTPSKKTENKRELVAGPVEGRAEENALKGRRNKPRNSKDPRTTMVQTGHADSMNKRGK